MRALATPSRLHRACALVLVVAVLLAQALALMHRSLHGSGGSALRSEAVAQAQHAHEAASADGLSGLFGSHSDASDCRLFDALGQAGCTPAALVLPIAVPPATVLAVFHGEFVARWAALFDARGPPVSR